MAKKKNTDFKKEPSQQEEDVPRSGAGRTRNTPNPGGSCCYVGRRKCQGSGTRILWGSGTWGTPGQCQRREPPPCRLSPPRTLEAARGKEEREESVMKMRGRKHGCLFLDKGLFASLRKYLTITYSLSIVTKFCSCWLRECHAMIVYV